MLPKEKPNFQEMDVLELFKTKSALDDLKNKTTDYLNEVKDILKSRYNNRAKSELQLKGQDFGTVTIADNNCKVKVSIRKSVSYDQEKLCEYTKKLLNDDITHIVDFNIKESVYKNLSNYQKNEIDNFRTVKESYTTITKVEE
tara:strand:+ start:287 stop:715 length:429 start_codon:yes stop_codon:yes gene_type:complete